MAPATLAESLRSLRGYAERGGLWHSVINERAIRDEWIAQAVRDLRFTA